MFIKTFFPSLIHLPVIGCRLRERQRETDENRSGLVTDTAVSRSPARHTFKLAFLSVRYIAVINEIE